MEQQEIHDAISTIMDTLKQQGTPPKRIWYFKCAYNVFERYLHDNNITKIDESICLEFIRFKTGLKYDRFECVVANKKVSERMRPLLLLLRYFEDGQFHDNVRKTIPPFICPACFRGEYEAFCEELVYRGYSDASKSTITQKVKLLINYLTAHDILSSTNITIQVIEEYLETLKGKSVKYIGVNLYVFRKYFSFLYDRGYI